MTGAGEPRRRFERARRRAARLVPAAGTKPALLLAVALTALLGAVTAIVALSSTSSTTGTVGPGRVEVRAGLGDGVTELRLPPFGTIWADTHDGPVGVDLRVDEVDVTRVQRLLTDGEPQAQLVDDVEKDLRPLTDRLARKALALSAVIGAAVGLLVPRRRWYTAAAGCVGAVAGVSLLLGVTWSSFDATAFETAPVFDGPLAEAPRIVTTVLQHVEGFAEIQDRYAVLSDQIADLYSANLAVDAGLPHDQTVILHVSDIHLNPVGLELTRQLAAAFAVHAVIDTGDLTSFGQPVEGAIAPLIEAVPAPYLYVPGNHDSPEIREQLTAAANLTILDGQIIEVGEVRVLGAADPTYTAGGALSEEEAEEVIDAAAPALRSAITDLDPHLVAVHHPRQAWPSAGLVETVVAGHYHHTSLDERRGTRYFVIGSTGAQGLGEFTGQSATKYEAELLRYSGTELVAVDYVVVEGRDGTFRISRRALGPVELEPRPPRRGWGWR